MDCTLYPTLEYEIWESGDKEIRKLFLSRGMGHKSSRKVCQLTG
jgi:hypothetical protein